MEKKWKQWQTLFYWTPKSLWMVTAAVKLFQARWNFWPVWSLTCFLWYKETVPGFPSSSYKATPAMIGLWVYLSAIPCPAAQLYALTLFSVYFLLLLLGPVTTISYQCHRTDGADGSEHLQPLARKLSLLNACWGHPRLLVGIRIKGTSFLQLQITGYHSIIVLYVSRVDAFLLLCLFLLFPSIWARVSSLL